MKNKKSLVLMIVATVMLILITAGITYAFFAGTVNMVNNVEATVTLPSTYLFTSLSGNSMSIDLSASNMMQAGVGNIAATNNASITAQLTAGSESDTTTCSYDVIFVWDSEEIYSEPDKTLASGEYEFSVKSSSVLEETDISTYTFTNNQTILFSDSISSYSTTKPTTKTYEIMFNIHNLDIDQDNIEDKYFEGHIQIVNVDCVITSGAPEPLGEESYVGYYADVDDDGTVDGIIFFDYTQGADETKGIWNVSGVKVNKVTTGLNEYELKQVGSYDNVVVPRKTTANPRFYIIDLEDSKPKSNDTTAYWYKGAWGNWLYEATEVTSLDFGTGKANTEAMKDIWLNEKTRTTSTQDIWSIDFGDKFVLSYNEWRVLGSNFAKTKSSGDDSLLKFSSGAQVSFGATYYWSSSAYNHCYSTSQKATGHFINSTYNVRLAQIF